jgi:hypothetical protein
MNEAGLDSEFVDLIARMAAGRKRHRAISTI